MGSTYLLVGISLPHLYQRFFFLLFSFSFSLGCANSTKVPFLGRIKGHILQMCPLTGANTGIIEAASFKGVKPGI